MSWRGHPVPDLRPSAVAPYVAAPHAELVFVTRFLGLSQRGTMKRDLRQRDFADKKQ
jgi:hypothetical protein